jgi:SSS family transporter
LSDGTLRAVSSRVAPRDCGTAEDGRFGWVIGGVESNGASAGVWRVSAGATGLEWTRFAELPVACVSPAAAVVGRELIVVGRDSAGAPFGVRVGLESGAVTAFAVPGDVSEPLALAAQDNALVLAGRDAAGVQGLWRRAEGVWKRLRSPPFELRAQPPVRVGAAHWLFAGAAAETPLLLWHSITDTWTVPAGVDGETLALGALGNGRWARRVRGADGGETLRAEQVEHRKRGLAWLDYAMLGGYFALNLLIGFVCARRQADSDHFFRASGRLQWWALGISYMATALSSISFMAYPATAYASDWLLIGVPVFQSAAVVAAGFLFIGLFRRLNVTTVFEYLEARFGRAIRLLTAVFLVLSQIGGRLSVVMLLPAMAFSAVTGLNVYLSVGLMGVVTVIYCLKGGMKAVVWTDVLQFVLMYGALAVALTAVAGDVPGGLGAVWDRAHAEGKLRAFLLEPSLARPTVWVFCCLAVTTVFLQLSDQTLMQRALSAPDERAARRSVMLAGMLNLPMGVLLFFIGTALFVFYGRHPERLDPALPNDSIFPFFVGNELPRGVVGLIIAGIFAAAMSTVSGAVNAIAAIVVRDFLLPARPESDEATRMRWARLTTVASGGLATAIALVMAGMNIRSLWETFAALMALIGGGFPGIFALGLLTRRANAPGVAIGLAASIGITFAVKQYTATNVFLFTSVAVGSCMAVGYVASLLFAPPRQPLAGLTIHTLERAN